MSNVARCLEDRAIVILSQNGKELKSGNIYDIREVIEEMVEEKIGVFVSLQEYFDTEDHSYEVCVHSDAFEDCDEDEIDVFLNAGLSECAEESMAALLELLAIDVKFSHYID